MKPKEYKAGDKLYKVVESHGFFSAEPPEWSQEEVTIVKANNSSIYTKRYEDLDNGSTMRYPIKAKFPLQTIGKTPFGEYWYLTDDPNLANEETNAYKHRVELQTQLEDLYEQITSLPTERKEDMINVICDKLGEKSNE